MPFVMGRNGNLIYDTITPRWHRARMALSTPTNFNVVEIFADGMEVGEARSAVANRCLDMTPKPEWLFFLDNDVLPLHDAFAKLFFRARHFPDYDIFCGVYTCKWANPPEPLIYRGNGNGPFWDWKVGEILTTEKHGITSVHMGLTLIKVSLLERMKAKGIDPLFVTENKRDLSGDGCLKTQRGTEDIYFCRKAEEVGCKIMVDTSVLAGHEDKATGIVYGLPADCGAVNGTHWLKQPEGYAKMKKALDLGFGGHKRNWDGHRTYSADLRGDTKPDYVMDSSVMPWNFPDDHFDLTASSHHLEHLGRWIQEDVWKEVFRVTKPGGKTEHIVPSLEWAAAKMTDGCWDESVYNVLYGAQEAHGYARDLNSHFFGYTKQIGIELAEAAGFEDVVALDWRDDPSLGYNLMILGSKPALVRKKRKDSKRKVAELAIGRFKAMQRKARREARRAGVAGQRGSCRLPRKRPVRRKSRVPEGVRKLPKRPAFALHEGNGLLRRNGVAGLQKS